MTLSLLSVSVFSTPISLQSVHQPLQILAATFVSLLNFVKPIPALLTVVLPLLSPFAFYVLAF